MEELGLTSLERVEMMVALEEALDTSLDESAIASASTLADLRRLTTEPARSDTDVWDFPAWNRASLARAIRSISLTAVLLPLTRVFAKIHVNGLHHLDGLTGPVIFASNH